MERNLQHILMTRFNLATPGREAKIRNQKDWLSQRFELFEGICIPSVVSQTRKDFTWIVYFDKDTPKLYKDKINELKKEFNFIPYFTGLFESEGWPLSIKQTVSQAGQYLLTSRLDNDDALASDYIESTRQYAEAALEDTGVMHKRIGIVLTRGYVRNKRYIYKVYHPSNAFVSWIEPWPTELSRTRTALGISHMTAETQGSLIRIDNNSGWLQLVHGNNVSNKIRGHMISPSAVRHLFPKEVLLGLEEPTKSQVLYQNMLVGKFRIFRDIASTYFNAARRKIFQRSH